MMAATSALGLLICLASLVAAISPQALMKFVQKLQISTGLRIAAAAVRILIGVVLILAAPLTDYALAFEVIGILLILIGVILLCVSNKTLQMLVDWATKTDPIAMRIGALFGLAFGGFLVYASA